MQKHRFLLVFMLKVWFLALTLPVFAQPQRPGQWVGDLYYINQDTWKPTILSISIDENDRVQDSYPQPSKSENFPFSVRTDGFRPDKSYWRDDAQYTVSLGPEVRNENGTFSKTWHFAKWTEEDGWCFLGELKTGDREWIDVIPCDDNRFIVISQYEDLTGNNLSNSRTPFARVSLNPDKKELRLDSPIDHGQDEIRKYMSDEECFKLALFADASIIGDHATLINRDTGLYWIFSLKSASLLRTGNIFRKVTPEMIGKGGFSNAVLCVNPEKAGTLLIAAQDEDYFIKAIDPYKLVGEFRDKFGASPEDTDKMLSYYVQENLNSSPFIIWYRIYPESGKVEKLKELPEGASWFRDDMKSNSWRPMPDGSVKLNWDCWKFTDELSK